MRPSGTKNYINVTKPEYFKIKLQSVPRWDRAPTPQLAGPLFPAELITTELEH